MGKSPVQLLAEKFSDDEIRRLIAKHDPDRLRYAWEFWARPEQLEPPGGWLVWLILAGRRFGKTRAAAEWIRRRVETGVARNIIIAAPTANDLRTDMIKGPSGLLSVCPPWDRPLFNSSENTLRWKNGARAVCLSAEEPERFRGKEADTVWCDEIAAWKYPEAWDLLRFCGGSRPPRRVVTTTPKPTPLVKALLEDKSVHVVKGSTFDNIANLAPEFIADMRNQYEGTRLGRQELFAELLDDVEGALWNHDMIERSRWRHDVPFFNRVVVGVDPSGSAKKTADTAGIVVCAIAPCNCLGRADTHAFVLEDCSGKYDPAKMGDVAIALYKKYRADRIVIEDNFGGKLTTDVLSLIDKTVATKAVRAKVGKRTRAEPIAALYEKGRVHHIGMHKELEDEMCSFAPLISTESPGRLDAMVWALTDLMLGESKASFGDKAFKSPARTFADDAVDDGVDWENGSWK